MAAEGVLAAVPNGCSVTVVDGKPSVGRKLLVAGKGGLNLTHDEPLESFLDRYGRSRARLEPFVRAFPPSEVRAFADALGQATYVGSSGRVFPREAKAAPLLRAWVARLKRRGVRFRTRCRFAGFAPDGGEILFEEVATAAASRSGGPPAPRPLRVDPPAAVFALGGASWPETGSDGRWVDLFRSAGIEVTDLLPANAGLEIDWPGTPPPDGTAVKSIALSFGGERCVGELTVTRYGLEGTPVYRLFPAVRDSLLRGESAALTLDLKPDLDEAAIARRLSARGARSLSTALARLGLGEGTRRLLRALPRPPSEEIAGLARRLKSLPLPVRGLRPIAEAISSAGGVRWDAIDERLMMRARPGRFVAGEMIDWEAPTGGYLLQACLATGRAAGRSAAEWWARHGDPPTAVPAPPVRS